ncbi:MAG: hypothetical protein LBL36_02915 [Clostridiales Family XIII bacterium]|jgi:dGTPase|nr:hypothetical protein [Clostridiales Family XIII bacterium]
MILSSDGKNIIAQSQDCAAAMNELRAFMFENVYQSEKVKRSEELDKIKFLIESLYDHYSENPQDLPAEYVALIEEFGKAEMVKDQIAGMTDRYAIDTFERFFVPSGWRRD